MKDLQLTANNDLIISNGDLVIGYSDLQHQEHLLITQKGQIKESPDVGVGIENFLNDSEIDEMLAEITSEFTKDGMQVKNVEFDEANGTLDYDANY